MKIILTGGAGFIGSWIADHLLDRGHEILIIDDLSSGRYDNLPIDEKKCHFYQGSITDFKLLLDLFTVFKPDAVCHQAAQASLLYSHDFPAADALINTVGTINVVEAAKHSGCPKMVMASTMAVFPNMVSEPNESMQPEPERPYGIAKYAAEMYLKNSGLKWAVLRYGNVYGPRQVPVGENQLIARLFSCIYTGEPKFEIYGNGEQKRDFIYVADIARANANALEERVHGVFHLGSQKTYSVIYVVNQVASISKRELKYKHGVPKKEPNILKVKSFRGHLIMPGKTDFLVGLSYTDKWWQDKVRNNDPESK